MQILYFTAGFRPNHQLCTAPFGPIIKMVRVNLPKPRHSHTTLFHYEGLDLSHEVDIWKKKATSDCRLELMTKLLGMNLGLASLEIFNETLGLQLRSEKLKKKMIDGKNPEKKVVREAMMLKTRDETWRNKELKREMDDIRMELKKKYGENTRKTRGMIKMMRKEAQVERSISKDKYKSKVDHLQKNHGRDEEEMISRVPPELKEYADTDVFSKQRFDNIMKDEITIVKIGPVILTEDQDLILKMHPKFAILENLKMEDLELDFEIGYGKYRYEMRRRRVLEMNRQKR